MSEHDGETPVADERLRKLIDEWPRLTDEQCERLARLLGPRTGSDAA